MALGLHVKRLNPADRYQFSSSSSSSWY